MLNKSVDPVVSKGILNETRELNIKQRKSQKMSALDKFFEKTSTLGASAVEIPIWLVKEFSLSRLNSYGLLLIFGSTLVWSILRIRANLDNFFNLIFPILIAILSIYKMIQAILNFSLVYKDSRRIRLAKDSGYKNVPLFVKRTYRTLIIKRVDINWFSFLYYGFSLIYLIIPQLLKGKTIPYSTITFTFANLDKPWGVYNVVKYSLGALFIFHVFYLIWTQKRINTVNNFYQYEIIPNLEQLEIKKTRHARWRRVCVIAIMIALIIPILINRILKNRGIIK